MDKEIMTLFYEKVHEDAVGDAVQDCEAYRRVHGEWAELEKTIHEKYKDQLDIIHDYNTLMEKLTEEEAVIQRQMYLLGASDRDRMLR